MDEIAVISRWVHLAAVIVALGGAVFLRFVLGPVAAAVLDEEPHRRLQEALRDRWRPFVHGGIGLILLSGLFNIYLELSAGRPNAYLLVFLVKLFAALAIFFLASALVGRSPAFEALRSQPRRWLTLIVALAGLIVLLSAIMGRFDGHAA